MITDIGKGSIYTVNPNRDDLMESKLPGTVNRPPMSPTTYQKEREFGYVYSTEEWDLEAKE